MFHILSVDVVKAKRTSSCRAATALTSLYTRPAFSFTPANVNHKSRQKPRLDWQTHSLSHGD